MKYSILTMLIMGLALIGLTSCGTEKESEFELPEGVPDFRVLPDVEEEEDPVLVNPPQVEEVDMETDLLEEEEENEE